jgi:DNA-binding PadR family transcriptional regulator
VRDTGDQIYKYALTRSGLDLLQRWWGVGLNEFVKQISWKLTPSVRAWRAIFSVLQDHQRD